MGTKRCVPLARQRTLCVESLESRRLLTGLPFGATQFDTGEFLLGTVTVTPVLLESNGQVDANTENWTPAHIQEVLTNVREGMDWWIDTLATLSPGSPLNFTIDTTYANSPVGSKYEPISRRSNDYALWTSEFLSTVGFDATGNLESDMRAFNHAQRVKHDTDWAFTIFVAPGQNDSDGQFAVGGSFNRAFAFAGGLFMVVPSTRPASTYAHETGHIFWGRDEYSGGGSYADQRGYYNTQNLNAANNPNPGFEQQPSIMAAGSLLDAAYDNHVSPPSTLAMVGWQDSDADGIFDVLDVPLQLTGTGYFDTVSSTNKFKGHASVQTLPTLNSAGLRNDITINRIGQIEARFDGGPWQLVSAPNVPQTALSLNIHVPTTANQIELRAREASTGVTSNVFSGRLSQVDATLMAGINGGIWIDSNRNSLRDVGEKGQPGWLVELIDGAGNSLALRQTVEPDQLPAGVLPTSYSPNWSLTVVGSDSDGRVGAFVDEGSTSTGSSVFKPYAKSARTFTNWNSLTRRLQVTFSAPTSTVQIDAVGDVGGSYGRLEAYNAAGQLLGRYTTALLGNGQPETMSIARDTADIAYVIAGGHANRNVKLDNLQYGPRTVTTTGELGTYSFPGLSSGSYLVRVTPQGAFQGIDPDSRVRSAAVVAGVPTADVDFGFRAGASAWQNPDDPYDVNADGLVSALDALLIINEINAGGARDLRGSNIPAAPYIDVTGDSLVSALDVLQVVNFINLQRDAGEGEAARLGAGQSATGQSLIGQYTMNWANSAAGESAPDDSVAMITSAGNFSADSQGIPAIDRLFGELDDDQDAWEELLAAY